MVVAWVLLCSFSGVLAGECKVLQNDSYLQYVVQSHTLPRAFSNFWRTLYFAFWMLLLTLLIHDGSLARIKQNHQDVIGQPARLCCWWPARPAPNQNKPFLIFPSHQGKLSFPLWCIFVSVSGSLLCYYFLSFSPVMLSHDVLGFLALGFHSLSLSLKSLAPHSCCFWQYVLILAVWEGQPCKGVATHN